jgi:hypothetical protein
MCGSNEDNKKCFPGDSSSSAGCTTKTEFVEVSAYFVHQVVELTFIFCEMKKEDNVCGTTAWHLCMLYDLCLATKCTDLTPVYAQGMLQAGMA